MIKGMAVCFMIIDCLACAWCLNGYQKLYKKDLFRFIPLINIVILINVLNIISLISPSKLISRFAYSVYSAIVGWFVFILLMFYLYYMDVRKENIRRSYILIPILIGYSISNLLNFFFEHEFAYRYVSTVSGEPVLSFKSYWPHLVYETFCVMIACCGYSSLNVLKDIDIDVIKLDMAFLRKAQNGERAKTIIQMVVELTKKINILIIVEGVETKEQKEFLEDIGCEIFQGYYFAKPVNLNDFENEYMCE